VTRLAERGATVALNHLPDDPAGPAAAARLAERGHAVGAVAGNVAQPGAAEAMVGEAIARLGRHDFLIHNAGTPGTREKIPRARLEARSEVFWQLIRSTNRLGPFRWSHAGAEGLRASRGAVVNVASIAGLTSLGSSFAYGASKAGVVNLSRNRARALAPEVRVNAVAPGHVETPRTSAWEDRRRDAAERALLKRNCQPEDIAEAIVFLAVGGAMITGQTLVVDGGLTL
jgi:3-oxoacyl-[acyl-carrier protein] reductase